MSHGGQVDLHSPLPDDGEVQLRLLTKKNAEALSVMRHSCAHVMAQAVMRLYTGTGIRGLVGKLEFGIILFRRIISRFVFTTSCFVSPGNPKIVKKAGIIFVPFSFFAVLTRSSMVLPLLIIFNILSDPDSDPKFKYLHPVFSSFCLFKISAAFPA